tara:strand:+ start:250 stop:810 length:561 start_codon:yes stop_codon:yes gene_type:complete
MNQTFAHENFIREYYTGDTSLTQSLINYHHENIEYKGLGYTGSGVDPKIKNSIDVTFFNNSHNVIIEEYFKFLNLCLTEYVEHFNLTGKYKTANENLISYFPENDGGFHDWHYERNTKVSRRELVFMTYLNNVFEGGETLFKYQNKTFRPEEGITLIWPAGFTHVHKGNKSPQEKYIVTGWFENII